MMLKKKITQMEVKLFFYEIISLLMILVYLYSRTQINFTVAIDFTASNGEYSDYPLVKNISN